MQFLTQPFKHQVDALNKSYDKANFALLMEQGTGKSKVILDTTVNLFLEKKVHALIIVAPAGVHRNWITEEIPKHVLPALKTKTFLYHSNTAKGQRITHERNCFLNNYSANTLRIVAINPEALLTQIGLDFIGALLCKVPSMLVVDEAGKLLKTARAKKTKRHKALMTLARLAKYRRILTGTPITKSPLDVYGQFEFLDQKILGFTNYFSFRSYFADIMMMGMPGKMWPKTVRYKNIEKLVEMVSPHSFRVLKSECLDLPKKVYSKHYFEIDDEQRRLYTQLKNDNVAFPNAPIDEEALLKALQSQDVTIVNNALSKLIRLRQILSGHMKLENGNVHALYTTEHDSTDNPRILALLDAIEDIEGKIIIWCSFTNEIEMLLTFFGVQGVGYYGAMNASARATALQNFKQNPDVRYFIANPECGGVGLTINEASTVVYFSNDFKLENRLQSEDRCHRIGQTQSVLYIDLIASDTVDEHILRNLQSKMRHSVLFDNIK